MAVLWLAGLALPQAGWATIYQHQPPAKIFAAVCSTCHGADGLGGVSWIDGTPAPGLVGFDMVHTIKAVRRGVRRAMPGFGHDQITDEELQPLAEWLAHSRGRVNPPTPPPGQPVVLEILDADPWYRDDGSDIFPDTRRVELGPNQYLKVINTGRTWHTITADEEGADSGLIGNNQYPDTGYYYADPKTDLPQGCVAYHCHLHPYMQTEICTPGSTPRPLTKAGKNPLPPPTSAGVGEIWVNAQTQDEDDSDPADGAMQVLDPGNWKVSAYIPNVGNNPHSSWSGKNSSGEDIVITASWHDNVITMIDANKKQIIVETPTGAAAAHVQVSPMDPKSWVVTHHGASNGVERLDVDKLAAHQDPVSGYFMSQFGEEQSGPHGIWFCDDGDHFIVSNSFSNTVSLFSLASGTQQGWAPSGGTFPLNPSIMHGDRGGCRRGYSSNSDSASVSVFDIDVVQGQINRRTLKGELADGAGNLALSNTAAYPVRWTSTPIQSVVSPADATTHGRYMVVSNKQSFNVSIVALDPAGIPTAIYTVPGGLGAHGVTFGRKQACDSGKPDDRCYFAYVTFTFENYLGVYDLEKIENGGMGEAGSAKETLRMEGSLAEAIAADLNGGGNMQPGGSLGGVMNEVPITVVCPDCRSGVHVGDVPLHLTTRGRTAYLQAKLWVDTTKLGGTLNTSMRQDLEVRTETGGFGVGVRPQAWPW